MKPKCVICGKTENHSRHIKYGADLDNAVKHQFEDKNYMKTTTKEIKHLPRTWEKIDDVKIIDPDGWRDGTSWNKPIDRKEWNMRKSISTCHVNIFKMMKNNIK